MQANCADETPAARTPFSIEAHAGLLTGVFTDSKYPCRYGDVI